MGDGLSAAVFMEVINMIIEQVGRPEQRYLDAAHNHAPV